MGSSLYLHEGALLLAGDPAALAVHEDCCCAGPCGSDDPDFDPDTREFDVSVAGVAAGDCSDGAYGVPFPCANANGDYLCEPDDVLTPNGDFEAGYCGWAYNYSPAGGGLIGWSGDATVFLYTGRLTSGKYAIEVDVYTPCSTNTMLVDYDLVVFREEYDDPIDLDGLSDEPLTRVVDGTGCVTTSATCTVGLSA